MRFSIHTVYNRFLFKIWRRKRLRLFAQVLSPQPYEILLDVGGIPRTWTGAAQQVRRIDCLNADPTIDWRPEAAPGHCITTQIGDGCALPFADQSYDIAFSNSVIEHVGAWSRQVAFAAEIRRVGARLWVQTPAYECPIEPHFLAPCVHWLPVWLRKFVARWLTPWGWLEWPSRQEVETFVKTTRLLTRAEMGELFPDCTILTERLLWVIPKSYIAVRTSRRQDGSEIMIEKTDTRGEIAVQSAANCSANEPEGHGAVV
jgi:hypothetical protein